MKKRTVYTLLFAFCVIGFWVFENFYTPASYSNPERGDTKAVAADFLPSSTTGNVVRHDFFTLSYSEPHEQAEWVAYELKKSHLTQDDRERPHFIEDPYVKTKSADWRNYRGSGYDRGHLCPAGDRRFSEYAYNETFYTSNISPQNPEFNAGIWNDLELQVRRWCRRYGPLWVITGGILEPGLPAIGEEEVAVPARFFKVVVRDTGSGTKVAAFLMENRPGKGPLRHFLVPLDRVEALSGIDFFPGLSEPEQHALEGTARAEDWAF